MKQRKQIKIDHIHIYDLTIKYTLEEMDEQNRPTTTKTKTKQKLCHTLACFTDVLVVPKPNKGHHYTINLTIFY